MQIDALTLLNQVNQHIFCKNQKGVYIYANDSFAGVAGVDSKEAIIGKTDYDLIWRDQADFFQQSDREVLAESALQHAEEIQIRASGTARIIISKNIFRDSSGNVIGVVGNFFDCNQHVILEAKGTFDEHKHRLYLEFVPEWLSPAEVRVCFYLIHGFSASRIAEKTGQSVSAVRFHIENIKHKMQCKKNEIPEVAMREGIAWKIFTLQHVMGF